MTRLIAGLFMLLMTALVPSATYAGGVEMLTDEGYETLMSSGDAGKVVFIDFYADWCAPCHRYTPTFDALAEHYGRQAAFFRVNVDDCPAMVAKYNVVSVPMTVAIHSSDKSFRIIGDLDMSALQSFIVRNLIAYKADHNTKVVERK